MHSTARSIGVCVVSVENVPFRRVIISRRAREPPLASRRNRGRERRHRSSALFHSRAEGEGEAARERLERIRRRKGEGKERGMDRLGGRKKEGRRCEGRERKMYRV